MKSIVRSSSPSDPNPHQLLTKKQIAQELVKSERWVETQMNLGMPFLRVGRTPRFNRLLVHEWLQVAYPEEPQ